MRGRAPVLGALAGVGPAHVVASAALVREGRVVDLSIPLDQAHLPRLDPDFGRPLALETIVEPDAWADQTGSARSGFHLDAFGGSIHLGTHVDGLAHFVDDGRIFDGLAVEVARGDRGWLIAGAETIPPIVGRGVLVDMAAANGDRPLEGSHRITRGELATEMDRSGTVVGVGDVVLVRTGKIRELDRAPGAFLDRQPGIGIEAATWLADRGMAVYGSDTGGTEPQPVMDWSTTVHAELLTRRGIHLIEWMDLDDLAAALVETGRTEFLFVATPLRITGATGAWVRPIAIL